MSASSCAAAAGLRVRSPAIVSRQGISLSLASAAISKSYPLTGSTEPIERSRTTPIIAAKRWRNRIITRSHNADALSRDVVITDHDPGGCLTRDHDARGSSERGTLALAESVCLLGVETGVQSERLMH